MTPIYAQLEAGASHGLRARLVAVRLTSLLGGEAE